MTAKKHNWILHTGIAGIILYILISLLFLDEEAVTSRHKYDFSLILFAVAAIVFAPLLEEICFRGIFSKSRKIFIASLFAFPVFLLLSDAGIVLWISSGLFYLVLFLYHKFKIKFLWPIIVIGSSLIFAFIHYEVTDFQKIATSYYFLIQFGLGMILVWLTINYNILKAMLFHFLWNFLAMTAMVIYVQYPDEEVQVFENENLYVEWQRVPYFDTVSMKITSSESYMETKATDIGDFKKLLKMQTITQEQGLDLSGEEIYAAEPYMKYNFNITIKDTTNLKDNIVEFLEEEDLIYEIPE